MKKIYLAFYWHQHQPYYFNLWSGEFAADFPWVRLHGVKDYHGMAALLEEFPKIRQTYNYVPSLLAQIELYLEGKQDYFQKLSLKAPAELSEEEKLFILDHFFMANWDRMIKIYPRYDELRIRRYSLNRGAKDALPFFEEQDWRDLQTWANLAWIHPTTVEKDPAIAALFRKGRNFTEEDKKLVLDKHIEILRGVIPFHKKLQDSGQIEVTTTPYYHPILPLLTKMESAREGMPGVQLPETLWTAGEDAAEHVRRAVAAYEKHFGRKPLGMWPAEGSVSEAVAPIFAENGIRWIATDEEILERSVGQELKRDMYGHLQNPDVLYRPYRFESGKTGIDMIFRDHRLSDMIGFEYQYWEPKKAAENFIHRLKKSAEKMEDGEPFISVILDGENAWESYPNQGVEFFRELYAQLGADPMIETVTVSKYLEMNPQRRILSRLFPGSWISHNFSVWIGHPEENRAWDFLNRTRKALIEESHKKCGKKADSQSCTDIGALCSIDKNFAHAWDELFIAEGSDWFWWYGDDHFSGNDAAFDYLFREHLKNVYHFIGMEPPEYLDEAIMSSGRKAAYTGPIAFLHINFDGRTTGYFEWLDAGHYDVTKDGSVMEKATPRLIPNMYYGFDLDNFFLRVDFAPEVFERLKSGEDLELEINFAQPLNIKVAISSLRCCTVGKDSSCPDCEAVITENGGTARKAPIQAAFDRFLEIGIPFAALGFKKDEHCAFHVELLQKGILFEKAPQSQNIQFNIPNEYFEQVMWQA